MRHILRQILRQILGVLFLLLGVLGLFLPVLQGILFLTVGLLLLAPENRLVRRALATLNRRYPGLHARVEKILGKIGGR